MLPLSAGSSLASDLIPGGSRFELRLRTGIHSYSSHAGQVVTADFVAPVSVGGRVLIPMGASLRGTLTEVRRVGWGLRPNASIRLQLDQLEFPDGTARPVKTRLLYVDNAREKVDRSGRITGIRATSAMGFRLAGITRNVFVWDPLIQLVLAASTTAVLRFPEAEISYPPGTEIGVALEDPLEVDRDWPWSVPLVAGNPAESAELRTLNRRLSWRATTGPKAVPADIVNVLLVGEPEWMERAFSAAGWVEADPLTLATGWKTFHAVAENRSYPRAPMSEMRLDEQLPQYRYSKALNNYSKRHHLRIWQQQEQWKGRPVWAAASTHDVAITFSFSLRRTIHVIDRNIDNERAKVINDLVYTGCVDAAELMDRTWVPNTAKISNNGRIETDGAVAVLELNPCRNPQFAPSDENEAPERPAMVKRTARNVLLTIGNDFTVNNPVVQAGKGVQFLWRRMRGTEDWPSFHRQSSITASQPAAPSSLHTADDGTP